MKPYFKAVVAGCLILLMFAVGNQKMLVGSSVALPFPGLIALCNHAVSVGDEEMLMGLKEEIVGQLLPIFGQSTADPKYQLIEVGALGGWAEVVEKVNVDFLADRYLKAYVSEVPLNTFWESSELLGVERAPAGDPEFFSPGPPILLSGTMSSVLKVGSLDFYMPLHDSLVALYYSKQNRYVAGFFLKDKTAASQEWYFIEPIVPILKSLIFQPAFADSLTDVDFENIENSIAACFPNTPWRDHDYLPRHYVVYRTTDTDFSINLDPAGLGEIPNADPFQTSTNVIVFPVADKSLVSLYTDHIPEKDWWEVQQEALYLSKVFMAQMVSTEDIHVDLRINSVEGWASGGPGDLFSNPEYEVIGSLESLRSLGVNALTLLCDFAQGLPLSFDSREANTPIPHRHSYSPLLPPQPQIVHLFTGQQLGSFPSTSAVGDGGAYCPPGCFTGGVGRGSIIGLAEGIGGKSFLSPDSSTCSTTLKKLMEGKPQETIINFMVPGHHSLSLSVPDARNAGLDGLLGPAGSSAVVLPYKNYSAVLFQRFLLATHEIAHNLGATHSTESNTLMYTPLSDTTRFSIDCDNKVQIVGFDCP